MMQPEDQPQSARQGQQDGPAAFACASCGADTREDLVKAAFWGPQGLVAIEDIPARICQGCGEQFYDDRTAHRIEQIVHGSTVAPIRRITIPVFSLAAGGDAEPDQPAAGE